MAFPVEHSGSVVIPADCLEEARWLQSRFLPAMSKKLRQLGARSVEVKGKNLRFDSGGFFQWRSNWNILVPITDGSFEATATETSLIVKYRLTFYKLLLISSIGVGWLALCIILSGPVRISIAIKFVGIGWLWIFGMNYLITVIRFPLFIKRVVHQIAEPHSHMHKRQKPSKRN